MIQITCPNNNIPERTYAIEVLFADFLGCKQDEYSIQFKDDVNDYELRAENGLFIIKDHFFRHFPEPLSYLKPSNIPTELRLFHGLDLELPIIYGEDKFETDERSVVIGLDIFASTFFMLSRWEESLLGREERGDCDESQLFVIKHGIYNRPIVNEYVEFLRRLLPSAFPNNNHRYEVVLSHDVDGFVTPTWGSIMKDMIMQTIHGAPKNKILELTWKEEIKYKRVFPTAYSQFEFYTALTEKYNLKEWFYFKVCGKGETEATYLFDDNCTTEVVRKLKEKNNPQIILGFHPSQNMFNNEPQWNREVQRITNLLNEKPSIGRNHHLLYNHKTFRLLEKISDTPLHISNCVFHNKQGFRSGTCFPYHLFDLYQRRTMNLIEHPCQIMDTVIRYHKKHLSEEERLNEVLSVMEEVKRYQGELVLTWHIYIRNKKLIQEYYHWCEKVVQYAVK